jgi:hypothetical protein
MSNPWDIPPLPLQGDEDDDATYAGFGRVITQWERVEVTLSHLYSCFLGDPHNARLTREYGRGTIFRERLFQLRRAAADYFVKNCDQATEGQFEEVCHRAEGYSGRRNDVAHGVVELMHQIVGLRHLRDRAPSNRYCLVPAAYMGERWFDEANVPDYVYTSVELLRLEEQLFHLGNDVHVFYKRIEAACDAP